MVPPSSFRRVSFFFAEILEYFLRVETKAWSGHKITETCSCKLPDRFSVLDPLFFLVRSWSPFIEFQPRGKIFSARQEEGWDSRIFTFLFSFSSLFSARKFLRDDVGNRRRIKSHYHLTSRDISISRKVRGWISSRNWEMKTVFRTGIWIGSVVLPRSR